MAKISVRHSVAEAYGLLFGKPLTVLGLTWLPAVFYAAAADFLIHRMNAAMAAAIPVASGLLGEYAFFYFVALLVITAFFGAVIAVPLTRQAFGLRDERVAAYFVVGAREFRLFFAFLRYYVALTSVLVLFAIAAGVAITQGVHYATAHGIPAVWHGLPLETWFNSGAGAIAVIGLSLLTVRYGFFLDAIAGAEDHTRLSRAAALSQGNFWPIAITLFVVGVPASLILLACEMTFGGLNLAGLGLSSAAATPFAGILAAGLVVLHTLSAGASAGAYAELAEAVTHDPEPLRAPATVAPYVGPAEVYASAQHAVDPELPPLPAELPPEPVVTSAAEGLPPIAPELSAPAAEVPPSAEDATFQAEMSEAAQITEPMEIITPEAESGAPLPPQPSAEWVAPPPDAHFGSDPHDAQVHETYAHEAQTMAVPEPLATALAASESPPPVEAAHSVEAAHLGEGTAHPVEAQNASAEPVAKDPASAEKSNEPILVHPVAEEGSVSPKILSFDGLPEEVPDHAHDAELPPPPLDPAGVLAAQSHVQQLPPAA